MFVSTASGRGGPAARAWSLVVVSGVSLLLAASAPAVADDPPVDAADTVGFAGQPGDGATPDARSRFSYQLAAGQQVSDSYLVTNTGTVPIEVTVFATDAYNAEDGTFALLTTDEPPVDSGGWVTFDGQPRVDLRLEPQARQAVGFTVSVPPDASPGDHAAGIVVSAVNAEGTVKIDRRVATRLYARVQGDLQPALTISNLRASYAPTWNPFDGTVNVTATIQNNGNVALGAAVTDYVETYFGWGSGNRQLETLDEILPGNTRVITYQIHGVGQLGYLDAHVEMQPTVTEDALDPGPLNLVQRSAGLFAVPWPLVVLLLSGVAAWLLVRFRRSRDARRVDEWMTRTEEQVRERMMREAAALGEAVGGAPEARGGLAAGEPR